MTSALPRKRANSAVGWLCSEGRRWRPSLFVNGSRSGRKLWVERLEERCLLAVWSGVESVTDSGSGDSFEPVTCALFSSPDNRLGPTASLLGDNTEKHGALAGPRLAVDQSTERGLVAVTRIDLPWEFNVAEPARESDAGESAWEGAAAADDNLVSILSVTHSADAVTAKRIVGERFVVVGDVALGPVEIGQGGILGGQGAVGGSIRVEEGGTLAPGNSPGIIQSGDVDFRSTSTLEVEVEGVYAGTGYDQLDVQGTVSLGSVRLKLLLTDLTKSQVEGRELVIIQNDGTDPVSGLFVFARDPANILLSVPRTLNEGDVLLNSFANSGQLARITYQGGDGNDVAIRIEGPLVVDLVEQAEGNDLTLRRDGDQVVVSVNEIEVRRQDLAGLSGIKLLGSGQANRFTVDFGGGDPIPAGGLRVEGGGNAGDELNLINVTDRFAAHRYHYLNATDGQIELAGTTTSLITYLGLAPLSNDGTASTVELNLPDTPNPDVRLVAATASGFMTLLGSTFEDTTFAIPSTSLTIRGGAFEDNITVASVDPAYRAALLIDGKQGQDQMTLESNLELAGKLELTAEQITISAAGIATNQGSQAGSIRFRGDVVLATSVLLNTDHPTGSDGAVEFTGLLDSALGAARAMTLIAGQADVHFRGPVGSQTPAGIMQITSARNVSLQGVVAQSLLQFSGTGSTVLTGDVTTSGRIELTVNRDLKVNPNLRITADSDQSGTDPLRFTAGRSIRVESGTVLSSVASNLSLRANIEGTESGNVNAIVVDAATVQSARGSVELLGIAGQAGGQGVLLQAGARVVTGGSGSLTITGTAGAAVSSDGVEIVDSGTLVQTVDGPLTVQGSATLANGVRLRRQAVVEATGKGAVRLEGTGTGQAEDGIEMQDAGTRVQAGDGGITLIGNSQQDDGVDLGQGAELVANGQGTVLVQGTSATQHGLLITSGAVIRATGNGNVRLEGTATGTAGQGIEIRDLLTSVRADVGGVTMIANSSGREGLLIERNATIRTTNSGGITLQGTSTGAGGIRVRLQANIQAIDFGIVRLTGTSTAPGGHGVEVEEAGTVVQANSGGVVLVGNANSGDGIAIKLGALIRAINAGSVTLQGTATENGDDGVAIDGVGTLITTTNGGVSISGVSQGGDGIVITSGAAVSTTNGGTLFLRGDTTGIGDGLNIVSQSVVKTEAGGNLSLSGTSRGADGVAINQSTVEALAAGAIVISGTSSINDGVQLIGNTRVRAAVGNVSISGITTGILTIDEGIYVRDSEVIGTGGILLSAASSAGSGIDLVNSQLRSDGAIQMSGRTTANNFLYYGIRLFSSEGALNPTLITSRDEITITGQATVGPAFGVINASTMRNSGSASILMQLITTGTTALRMAGSQALIASEDGSISISGNGTMVLADNARIASEGAEVSIGATANGNIVMADVASIASWNGIVTLNAVGDVTLGGVSGTEVRVSSGGAIFDGGDTLADIAANRVALRANTGIGSSNPLDTAMSVLAARNAISGDLRINNNVGGELTIGTVDGLVGVTNNGGSIEITNASPLTVADDVVAARNVTLVAADRPLPGDDLVINSADSTGLGVIEITATNGNIVLSAGDDFILPSTAVLSASGTITVTATSTYLSANTARFTGLKPQTTYRVSATWNAGPTRARQAPLRIGGILGGDLEIIVDQQVPPDDLLVNGTPYEVLGTFRTTGTQLDLAWLAATATEAAESKIIVTELPDAPPKLVVHSAAQSLQGGKIDFGRIDRGLAVSQSFTITNHGSSPLLLDGILNLPDGFFLGPVSPAGLFGGQTTTLVADGNSATFEIRVDSTMVGTHSGTLSFTSNDPDASPFELPVSTEVVETFASTVQILDDGDPITEGPLAGSYSDSGNLRVFTQQGFENDVREAAAGGSSETMTYTFSNLTLGGQYRLAATWTPFGNRTTAAPFIVSGAIENPTTVTFNQRVAPREFYDRGFYWNQLGTFRATGNHLTVTLVGVNDGTVIADAIRIERLFGPKLEASLANSTLINGISQVQFPKVLLNGTVRQTLTISNTGLGPLELPSTLRLPAGFRLVTAADPVNPPSPTTLFSSSVSSTSIPAGGQATFTVEVDSSIPGRFEGNLVFDNNDPNQSPFGIRLLADVASAVVIDDDDPGFTANPAFSRYVGQGYQNDVRAKYLPRVGDQASWTFMGAPAGTYRVSATWSSYTDRATNAPYSIRSTLGSSTTGPILVNQRLTSSSTQAVPGVGTTVVDDSIPFADLVTTYTHVGGDLVVTLADTNINGWIAADAIRVERLSPLLLAALPSAFADPVLSQSESLEREGTPTLETCSIVSTTSVSTLPVSTLPVSTATATLARLESTNLTYADVEPVLAAAVAHWSAVDVTAAEQLAQIQVIIADLPERILGLGSHSQPTIWLDVDGAGLGWYLAPEMEARGVAELIVASEPMPPEVNLPTTRVDLLTTVIHELGHVLGYEDLEPEREPTSVMTAMLEPGVRRLPRPTLVSGRSVMSDDLPWASLVSDEERRTNTGSEPLSTTDWNQLWCEWDVTAVAPAWQLELSDQP